MMTKVAETDLDQGDNKFDDTPAEPIFNCGLNFCLNR